MSHPSLTDLEDLASKTAVENGFSFRGVKLLAHLQPITIQVQISHPTKEDVSLEDCATFSKPMETAIDDSNLLQDAYVLEISSPGISDQLSNDRDFKTFKGFPIEVKYRDKEKAEVQRNGLLQERSDSYLRLNTKGKMKDIPRTDIIQVRLISPTG